ncbi:hypothetical protein HYX16_01585 [Candidatus Woesearchaeota archaeon]|nr:hypothetical protein [Candidatus Woesearchaeota archaeon]
MKINKTIILVILISLLLVSENVVALSLQDMLAFFVPQPTQPVQQIAPIPARDLKQYEMPTGVVLPPPPPIIRKPKIKDCNDGDKGDKPFEGSSVTFGFKDEAPKVLDDKCIDINNLKEAYCDENKNGQHKNYYCPSFGEKFYCLEGACVEKQIKLKTEIPPPEPPQLAQTNEYEEIKCFDSDKGIEPEIGGVVTLFYGKGAGTTSKDIPDYCEPSVSSESNILYEKYCKTRYEIATEKIFCDTWLNDNFPMVSKQNYGFCNKEKRICDIKLKQNLPKEVPPAAPPIETKCIDTDPKDEYAVFGIAKIEGLPEELPDKCESRYELRQSYCKEGKSVYYLGTTNCAELANAYAPAGIKFNGFCERGMCLAEESAETTKPPAPREVPPTANNPPEEISVVSCEDSDTDKEGFVPSVAEPKQFFVGGTVSFKLSNKETPEYNDECRDKITDSGSKYSEIIEYYCKEDKFLGYEIKICEDPMIIEAGGYSKDLQVLCNSKKTACNTFSDSIKDREKQTSQSAQVIPEEIKVTEKILKEAITTAEGTRLDISAFVIPLKDLISKSPQLDPNKEIDPKLKAASEALTELQIAVNNLNKALANVQNAKTETELEEARRLSRDILDLSSKALDKTDVVAKLVESRGGELKKAIGEEKAKREEANKVVKEAEQIKLEVNAVLENVKKDVAEVQAIVKEVENLEKELNSITETFLRFITGKAVSTSQEANIKLEEVKKKVEKTQSLIEEAKAKIENAKKLIEEGKVEDAKSLVNKAKESLQNAKKIAQLAKDDVTEVKNDAEKAREESRKEVRKTKVSKEEKEFEERLGKVEEKRGVLKRTLDTVLGSITDLLNGIGNLFT